MAVSTDTTPAAAAAGAAADKTAAKLILVVDDMPIFREPIAASLRLSGYEAVCASDGQEAMAKLAGRRPDLVLLDLAMPGMDGMSVLRALRAEAATADLPVIMLTAAADKPRVLEAGKLGVHDYLLKSRFSLKELLARVSKYVPPGDPAPASEPVPGHAGAAERVAPGGLAIACVPGAAPAPAATKGGPAAPGGANSATATSAEIPKLLNRQQCVTRAETALQAKALGGVVAQVIALAASPRSNAADLAALVARDPALAARVLQAANSAAYSGGRHVVSSVADAVRTVGLSAVRNIALSVGVFDVMPDSGPDGFNPIRCWQHSFAVATLCESLAQAAATPPGRAPGGGGAAAAAPVVGAASGIDPGIAYLVGLCHDLGEVLFHTHFAPEYRRVVEVQARTGRRREELEREMLGVSRGELVQTILRHLGLPEAIREPIEQFHERSGPGRAAGAGPLVRVLRLADAYATGVPLASGGAATVECLTRAECRAVAGHDDPPRPDAAELRANVLGLTAMLAGLSAREQAELTRPLFERRNVRLWVARDAALSAFDPVAAALDALAQAERHDRPPATAAEWQGVHGLAVLARSDTAAGFTSADLAKSLAACPRPRCPVLWLVGRCDGPAAAGPTPAALRHARPTRWPVPLQALADFVAGLDEEGAAPDAAA